MSKNGGDGGTLQAADDGLGVDFGGDGFRRLAAHVGDDEDVFGGALVGGDGFDEGAGGLERAGVGLEGGAVGDEPGAGVEDQAVGEGFEAVVADGGAGGDEVYDQVGVSDGGGDFEGAFGGDQERVGDAVVFEEAGGEGGEFGGDPQAATPRGFGQIPHGRDVVPRFGDDDVQGAVSESEIIEQSQDFAVGAALFGDDIAASDAQIYTAIAYADDDVAGALEEDGDVREVGDGGDELAGVGFMDAQSRVGEEGEGVFGEAAFAGEGEANFWGHRIP